AALNPADFENAVCVSAAKGQGMDQLEEKIVAFGAGAGESELTQERHMALAREAAAALRRAAQACKDGEAVDVAAVELNEALHILGRITGDQVDEKLLDDVFSRFCVGK
ncbi:MAG: tRNA uridine-5-carboxymethylaminomethyl(34) synthesis GTPase MnmE, partial [Clostridia bacterium]|nr:tRNA uridine-5-carboxymethylaminomethyl(34) synthesis GTPase MnmE [Clostridia bacterium]